MDTPARPRQPGAPIERRERRSEFDRIVAFSDGVLAIAITLLVLQIDVPRGEDDLPQALLDQNPDLFAYALSFAVIGRFWLDHHGFFSCLARFDPRLMTLNLLYLGLVVLVPFTSEVLGEYGDRTAAPVLYATSLGLAALVNWLMVRHALRRDLVEPERLHEVEGDGGLFALTVPGIFLLSIPIAFASPLAAELSWLVMFLVRSQISRRT